MTDGGDDPGRATDEKRPVETAETTPDDSDTAETAPGDSETAETARGHSDAAEWTDRPDSPSPSPSAVQPPGGIDEETLAEYTTDRRSLDPTVRVQWGIRTTITAVLLAVIVSAILANLDFQPVFGAVAVLVFLVLGVLWVLLRYRVWVYQIRPDSVYLERGVLTHVRTIVPYVRIQHVDTSRSALERALGLSTLVVYTAGSRGADVSIPGLRPEQARDLQQRLKELAIEAEGDDAL